MPMDYVEKTMKQGYYFASPLFGGKSRREIVEVERWPGGKFSVSRIGDETPYDLDEFTNWTRIDEPPSEITPANDEGADESARHEMAGRFA